MSSPVGQLGSVLGSLCCTKRFPLTLITSLAIFLSILTTTSTNQLSLPWTEIQSTTVLGYTANATLLQTRIELRSLSGAPLVFSCPSSRYNSTAPPTTVGGPCVRNSTSPPLDAAAAGIDEYGIKRSTVAMILFALGATACAILCTLVFQFHACRMDEEGRPRPGSKLCLRSPRQVVAALILALLSSALCGFLLAYCTQHYTSSVTSQWAAALPPSTYSVRSGTGVAALYRVSLYSWGAMGALALACCFGPVQWSSRAPFEQRAQHSPPAYPRGAAGGRGGGGDFQLRETVHLSVVAVPACEEDVTKNSFGYPLPLATYAPTVASPPEEASFSFSTPLQRT